MAAVRQIPTILLIVVLAPAGQLAAERPLCPAVIGIYPVDSRIDDPMDMRPRFEIRACGNGRDDIQLLGFRAGAKSPSLIEGGSQIELLIQTGTLLLIQMTAGSSSPTLVAQFRKGSPVLLGREDGVGGVSYREDHTNGDYAIITIPQKTFPDGSRRFPNVRPPHRYRLKIWAD